MLSWRVFVVLTVPHNADGAHLWRGRKQGEHYLPGHAEGDHLAEGGAHQEVSGGGREGDRQRCGGCGWRCWS